MLRYRYVRMGDFAIDQAFFVPLAVMALLLTSECHHFLIEVDG